MLRFLCPPFSFVSPFLEVARLPSILSRKRLRRKKMLRRTWCLSPGAFFKIHREHLQDQVVGLVVSLGDHSSKSRLAD